MPAGVRPQQPMARPASAARPMAPMQPAQRPRPAGAGQMPQQRSMPMQRAGAQKPAAALPMDDSFVDPKRTSGWKVALQFIVGILVIVGVAAAVVALYIKYYQQ